MTTIANLEVMVSADTSRLTSGLNTIGSTIGSIGSSIGTNIMALGSGLSTIGDRMSTVGNNISTAIAPLNDLALAGLDAAAGFEDIMVQMETFGGLSGDALEAVRQKALQLGADTKFSASDAASAMLELVKAGYDTETAMQDAGLALDLAAISGMSLEQSASVLSSTIAQFNLDPIDEAKLAVDLLAQGANASRADVSGLSDSLKNVGTVASTMGVSLEDTIAALSVLSNAGIEGAEAGTQLKSMLLNLTTSDVAKAALDDLNVSLYDSNGAMKDLDTVIDELSASMADMTPEEQTNVMKDLAGAYGITALSALMAAGGVDEMKDAMAAAPAASEIAQKSMQTFNGRVESLRGSVETLMITALTPLMDDVLSPLAGTITEVVNNITDWAGENPELASTIGGVVLGIGALGTVLTIVGPIVGLIGTAFTGLGAAVALVVSPLGLVALGIAGVVALLSNADVQGSLATWQGVFDMLPVVLQTAADGVKRAADDIIAGVRTFFRDLNEEKLKFESDLAAKQIVLGINVQGNEQFIADATSQLQFIDIASTLESDINASLQSGGPLEINLPQLQYLNESPADVTALASQIADPTAIQEAINTAIASGDTGALTALLPLSLELAEDPAIQMQTLLSAALDAGGENGAQFQALLGMATELDIDIASIIEQYQASLDAAAAAQTFNTTITANVKVNVGNVDMSAVGAAAGGGINLGASVPGFAVGTNMVEKSGLAFIHEGEAIVPAAQAQAGYTGGGGGNYTINAYGQSPYEVAEMVRRAQMDGAR